MKTAAIYARVSSDKQREENTIASQTAALVAFAREQRIAVPPEWVFEDDGYSGASLVRPGLERVRDLAAEGLIQAVLVYAPDRLSRRYAHQILLIEELARAGVETLFIRAPRGSTPEDELLVQFQGMIAEYERAQILERSRRGKRHRARQGEVSVLSGAPFGYRFIRKTDHSAAYYQIDEEQARIVRRVFELYITEGLSIGAIARLLNEQAIPTCKRRGRWERSTVWGMLRNPAYKGQACFGKTTMAPRQRITRPIRLRGGIAPRNSASHERAREDWIPIAVPPIVSDDTFALAQERLEANKNSRATADHHAQRRARSRELRQVRICPLSHIDAIERPRDPLLPLSRLRRVAAALRFGLQQSPGASGSSRRGRVVGNRATARRSPPYPERNRPTARSRARGGSDQTP